MLRVTYQIRHMLELLGKTRKLVFLGQARKPLIN